MCKENNIYKLPGPLLLLAGPGTGKTYQLAKRIKFLVGEKGVSPENITVITFTTAAAKNMQDRISDLSEKELYIPIEKQPRTICTIHSLGYRIILEKVSDIGLKRDVTVIYSDALRDVLVSDSAQIAGFNRDDGKMTVRCRQFGNCIPSNAQRCKICKSYQEILRSCSAVDYDDQILLACKLLREDQLLLLKYKAFCKHLLVDEYQDINKGQFNLISLLCGDQQEGLFVVGDDDQSIYSWRGGSPEFIRNFESHFGEKAKIKTLIKSFRCHPNTLEGAMAIIDKYDRHRIKKGKFSYKNENGEKIIIHNVPSDDIEAKIVKSIVEEALPSRSVLILFPYKSFAGAIISEFKKAKINFSAPLPLPGVGLPLVSTLSQWLNENGNSLAFRECLSAYLNNPDSGVPSSKCKKSEKKIKRESSLFKFTQVD